MNMVYDVVRVLGINSITSKEEMTFYSLRFAVDLIILKLKVTKSLGASINVKLSLLLSLSFKGTRGVAKPMTVISSFLPKKD